MRSIVSLMMMKTYCLNHSLSKWAVCFVTILLTSHLSLLTSSCGSNDKRFHLEGNFKNINQGEFYLYELDHGIKDTISVKDGHFVYDIPIEDTLTFALLFPNYSEIPIFAHPGAKVKIKGDVSHLKETKVKGTDENESMTAFRLEVSEMTPPEAQKHARQQIENNPESPINAYLLRRYFILGPDADYHEAARLCKLMGKAHPNNIIINRLYYQLAGLKNKNDMGKMPRFSAIDTKGDTITENNLKATANLVIVWASWSFNSQNIIHQLSRLKRTYNKDLAILSICIDASPDEGKQVLARDSIQWPNICDGKLWDSQLLKTFGLSAVPSNMLYDGKGNAIGRNMPFVDLEKEIAKLVK